MPKGPWHICVVGQTVETLTKGLQGMMSLGHCSGTMLPVCFVASREDLPDSVNGERYRTREAWINHQNKFWVSTGDGPACKHQTRYCVWWVECGGVAGGGVKKQWVSEKVPASFPNLRRLWQGCCVDWKEGKRANPEHLRITIDTTRGNAKCLSGKCKRPDETVSGDYRLMYRIHNTSVAFSSSMRSRWH
jgi:hypothetical protein